MGLKYIGNGAFIFHVPARDITDAEIKEIEHKQQWKGLRKTLLDSGLYAEEPKKVTKKEFAEPKAAKED